jgi:hypothetical protein
MNARRFHFALCFVLVAAPGAALAASGSTAATAEGTRGSVPPREIVQYGHIKSLTQRGARFQLRFDPAQWLQGVTATRAAVEDKAIRPGEAVPNDYYIVDEGHRLLTYLVPRTAHVAVVTSGPGPVGSAVITVGELAQIVKGKNPKHRRLMEPKAGFWIRIAIDTVRSLDQQYQP